MALAAIMRSPKSWLINLRYGVSPQPAQAPLNSNSGCCNCCCGMLVTLIRRRSNSGMFRKKSQFALSGSRRDDLAPLAKFALASTYRGEGKESNAIQLYKELIDHPRATVPKSTAQIELAAMYETTQPAEAARIYEQIRKDEPTSAAAQVASTRLQGNKPQ